MTARNGSGNGHSDDEIVRQALRELLADPKAGARVRAQAATQLGQMIRSTETAEDELPPDPMADLDELEEKRQERIRRAGYEVSIGLREMGQGAGAPRGRRRPARGEGRRRRK